MAHDGQDMTLTQATVLPDLLALTADAIAPCEKVLETAKNAFAQQSRTAIASAVR